MSETASGPRITIVIPIYNEEGILRASVVDLIDRLETLQNDDGSFTSVHGRWMEGDPVLITAYALTALQAARN